MSSLLLHVFFSSFHQKELLEKRDGKGQALLHGSTRGQPQHGDHRSSKDPQRSRRDGQENICLKDEMKKERMLITVSRGLTPPPGLKVKDEPKDERRNTDGKSKERTEKEESSDSSEDDKSQKNKHQKKKKKKKEKKKKKQKRD